MTGKPGFAGSAPELAVPILTEEASSAHPCPPSALRTTSSALGNVRPLCAADASECEHWRRAHSQRPRPVLGRPARGGRAFPTPCGRKSPPAVWATSSASRFGRPARRDRPAGGGVRNSSEGCSAAPRGCNWWCVHCAMAHSHGRSLSGSRSESWSRRCRRRPGRSRRRHCDPAACRCRVVPRVAVIDARRTPPGPRRSRAKLRHHWRMFCYRRSRPIRPHIPPPVCRGMSAKLRFWKDRRQLAQGWINARLLRHRTVWIARQHLKRRPRDRDGQDCEAGTDGLGNRVAAPPIIIVGGPAVEMGGDGHGRQRHR